VSDFATKFSRRDFLKFAGAGAAALTLGSFFAGFGFSGSRRTPEAEAQTAQQSWTNGSISNTSPIHAILLPTGKILSIAGSGYHTTTKDGPFLAEIIDPATGSGVTYTLNEDLFCCHHNHLANGNVLITGGQLQYDVDNPEGNFRGLNAVYEFDVYTNRFVKMQNMRHGRWYPTQLTLPDGRVWMVDGLDEYGGRNALVEIYNPTTRTTSIQYRPNASTTYTVGAGSSLPGPKPTYGGTNQGVSPFTSLYPRAHLMPSGLIAIAGMSATVYLVNPDPSANSGLAAGQWNEIGTTTPSWRDYGTSFLLPLNNTSQERGKVMITGGSQSWNQPALASSRIIDFDAGTNTSPVIRNTASMPVGRTFPCTVMLPNGLCAVFGGVSQFVNSYIHEGAAFDPATETWTTLPAAGVSRTYHSAALLLPDGRVWLASGTPSLASWEHRTEFYNPPYYYASSRPVITGRVLTASYGGTMRIPTSSSSITRVSLVRLGANTHHYDPNMRLVWLQVTGTYSGGIQVAAPINSRIAPPGPYMIHILNSQNVPSQGQIVQIPGGAS
jgi:hypothetical protein